MNHLEDPLITQYCPMSPLLDLYTVCILLQNEGMHSEHFWLALGDCVPVLMQQRSTYHHVSAIVLLLDSFTNYEDKTSLLQ